MTQREEQQSARGLTRQSLSQNAPRVSIVGPAHLPPQDTPTRDGAGALLVELQAVLLLSRPRKPQQIPRLLLVSETSRRGCRTLANGQTAAAAARINAQIQAKKGIQHVDVPPILAVSIPYVS